MAKTKHGWDWGRFNPDRCGEFVVGNKMTGAKFYVTSCHRTRKAARTKLGTQKRALASVKGFLVQFRNKTTGKIISETKISPKTKTKAKRPKTTKGPKGLMDRFKW